MTKLKLSEMSDFQTIPSEEMMAIKGGAQQEPDQNDTCTDEDNCESSGSGGNSYPNGWTFDYKGDTVARDSTSVWSKYGTWFLDQFKDEDKKPRDITTGVER